MTTSSLTSLENLAISSRIVSANACGVCVCVCVCVRVHVSKHR